MNPQSQKILQEITNEKDANRIFSLWQLYRHKLRGVRLLTHIENHDSKLLPKSLEKKEFEGKSTAFLQEFYKNQSLLAISNEILDNHNSQETIDFPIDYSLLLDSNFVGSIDCFLRRVPIENNHEAVTKALYYIRSNQLNCDALPYLFENAEHFKERKTEIKRTLASFLRFSSSTPKGASIEDPADLEFKMSETESLVEAERRITKFYGDKKFIDMQVTRQKLDFYMILSIIHIENCTTGGLFEKFTSLINIMHSELGGISLRELLVGYKYFKNSNSIFILANVPKLVKEANSSATAIRNISWDFHFFRLMETWASDTSKGKFFIPMLLTLDKRLADLNEIYPVKYSAFHDTEQKMYSVPLFNFKDKIDNKACRNILNEHFTPESIIQRREIGRPTIVKLEKLIAQKCRELDRFFLPRK
jgi:hypothetical protein